MALILNGAPVAKKITDGLHLQVQALRDKGVQPCLAIVRVGDNGSDLAYERSTRKRCAGLDIQVEGFALSADVRQSELVRLIEEINMDSGIHGCMILRPLPAALDEDAVCQALLPEKDVDGITARSLYGVFSGRGGGFPPCTAQACVELLEYYGVELAGARAAVIGRSLVVGKPLAMLLQGRNATVTMCHSKTRALAGLCREQDIIIAAAGCAGMIDAGYIRPGQIVLDVGINLDGSGHICGDVDFKAVEPVVQGISPVPGGVGAITTAILARHLVQAAQTWYNTVKE